MARLVFAALAMAVSAAVFLAGCSTDGGHQTAARPVVPGLPETAGAGEAERSESGGSGGANDAARVIALVLDRGDRVERIDAELRLDLTRADGAEAQLDASLCMARADRFRVRTTKWGFLVCDVVVRGDDAQALLSPVVREQAIASAEASVALGRVLGSLVGWYGGGTVVGRRFEIVEELPASIVVRVPSGADAALEWTLARIDGRTLRVRRFEKGLLTGVLDCSAHVDVDGVPLPSRLRFESEMGRIDVEVRGPLVNPPADDRPGDEQTFEPPLGSVPLG